MVSIKGARKFAAIVNSTASRVIVGSMHGATPSEAVPQGRRTRVRE